MAQTIVLIGALLATLIIGKLVQLWGRPPLPPGPKGRFPFMGMTFDMPSTRPWERFGEWAARYGPIMHFRTGLQHVIVISDAKVYRELVGERGAIYSSRPPSEVGDLISGGRRSVLMPYGPRWRMARRIFTNVLTAKKCDGYTAFQQLESLATIHNMLNEPKDFVHELHRYALSVARTVAFGKRVPTSSSEFGTQLREVMENFSNSMTPGKYLFEAMPALRKLPRFAQPWLHELEKYKDLELSFALDCYRDAVQQAELHPNRPCIAREVKKEMEKAGEDDEVQAASTCMEILGAGSETTANALHFTIFALATHPEVVKKAHEELDRVIGQDRFPTWEDEPSLPYIRAIIKENQRWRSISPMSFPHYTSKDDVYNGYYIPKNCVVRVNHWLMHNNDKQYPHPETFEPERFINHNHSAAASANLADALQRDHFSYGGGKRICPGIHLAERSLFIMTSRMLQTFEFGQPMDPKSEIPRTLTAEDVGVSTSLIMAPGSDFYVDFRPRSEKIGELSNIWGETCEYPNAQASPRPDGSSQGSEPYTQSDGFTPPADSAQGSTSFVDHHDHHEPEQDPSASSELFTTTNSLLPSAFNPLEGGVEEDHNYSGPTGLEQNQSDFLHIDVPNPDWIFSVFDPYSHLDSFSIPSDCQMFDVTGSAAVMPPDSQLPSPPNAQEPPVKYNIKPGPQQDNWLLSNTDVADNRSLIIPQLGGDSDRSTWLGLHFQLAKVDESHRAQLQRSAQMILERPLWRAVSLANFPSKAKLDHCIDLFFVNFRPPISFIHQPTFNPASVPEVLLLAIVAIGARFSSMKGAMVFANSIAELTRRMLLVMSEQDPSLTYSEHCLTAQLLQAIHGRASGHRRLYAHSRDLRSALVRHAGQAGLFQETKQPQGPSDNRSASTESRWMDWVPAERQRRLGWAIYELDATVSILHNERPIFSIGNMGLYLPDEDVRWEAPTAYSWAALHPWQPSQEDRIDFRKAARESFIHIPAEDIHTIDDQHLHVLTITLTRFLWSMKELQTSPLIDNVPENWPLVAHKRTLLTKLDEFRTCPDAAKANKDDRNLRRIVERLLIIHLCHLYGAGDLMDWLPALLRAGGQHKELRARMSRWGLEDGARLREVAHHSARILALSRSFPFNSPNESFYVFYAGAALWCTGILLGEFGRDAHTEVRSDDDECNDLAVLWLDSLDVKDEDQYNQLKQWLREGRNVRVGLFGVPDLGSKKSRAQVLKETLRILQNMGIWELSKGFSEFIRQLLVAESRE
ncbi:hypothetical protein FOBRF1_013808 [Fusarium oxysporum]